MSIYRFLKLFKNVLMLAGSQKYFGGKEQVFNWRPRKLSLNNS